MNEKKCRAIVRERANGLCEVKILGICEGRQTEYQHRKARVHCTKAELWLPSNGLAVCGFGNASGCHGWIHQNPAKAYELGFSVKSTDNPIEVPVDAWYGAFVLDDAGGFTPALELGGVS